MFSGAMLVGLVTMLARSEEVFVDRLFPRVCRVLRKEAAPSGRRMEFVGEERFERVASGAIDDWGRWNAGLRDRAAEDADGE